jgi:hypothetical protein
LKKLLTLGVTAWGVILFFAGCDHGLFHSRIAEGTIEYKIVVLDSANSLAKFAPDKMTVKFKKNKAYAEMVAGMGLFETAFINDEPGMKITQMVRMLTKKVAYVADTAAISKELTKDVQLELTPTDETKMIAGYKCKKVIAKYKDNKFPQFEIYYTKEIKLENPNWATPFKDIDGVLMEYKISKYGFYMEFTAQQVTPDKIDDNVFKMPPEYKLISKQQIDELYKGFE